MNGGNKISDVFIVADNVLSPLGKTTAENFASLKENQSAVKAHYNPEISQQPFFASLTLPTIIHLKF